MIRGELFKSSRTDDTLFARVRTGLAAALSGAAGVQRYNSLRPVLPLGGFDRLAIFAGGEQGFFYDNNDLRSMFQDNAGLVPVTGPNQPVGRQLDKSGRGNHRFQPTADSSRPMLRYNSATGSFYLEYNGVNSFLQTDPINLTAYSRLTVCVGVRKLSDAAGGMLIEFSANSVTTAGAFAIYAPSGAGSGNYRFLSGGTEVATRSPGGFTPPISNVLAMVTSISDDALDCWVDGVPFNAALDQGVGSYSNNPVFFGRRGGSTLPFNGHEYDPLLIGRALNTTERQNYQRYIARLMGVTVA